MTKWGETRKKQFNWNSYVEIFVDGDLAMYATYAKDTHKYDELFVEYMFGYNGCTKIYLVSK